MGSNVITFECLRRLREFRQSLKLAAAGVTKNVFALGATWKRKLQASSWIGKKRRDLRACQ